jgi:tRNA pseudouridine38/39 synthase
LTARPAPQVYSLVVRGTAFLYHQVRCMAAVLLMVGRRQEAPGIVAQLLDVGACARKPQYNMASEVTGR